MVSLPLFDPSDLVRGAPSTPVPSCEGCGACCMHMASPPFVTYAPALIAVGKMRDDGSDPDHEHPDWDRLATAPPEAKRQLADYHHQLRAGLDTRGSLEMPCLWFDSKSKRCRYHAHRPDVCREFPPGCDSCHQHRRYRGVETTSPRAIP
jgi:uncharacterized protein